MDNMRLRELESALQAKVAANKEIADAITFVDGTLVINPEHKAAFDANMAAIKEIQGLITDLKGLDAAEQWGTKVDNASVAAEAAATAAATAVPTLESKTIGELFVESEEFKSLRNGAAGYTMNSPWQFQGTLSTKDVYTAAPAAGSSMPGSGAYGFPSFGRVQRDPIVESAKRRVRVRDLFPARSTTAAVIEYFRVIGYTNGPSVPPAGYTTANNASVVPERLANNSDFASKPHTNLQFVGEQAPVRTIAHWEAAHRNVLADEPQLRGIIDNELLYGLRLAEDQQILFGTGGGEDLLGIMSTAAANMGVQSYAQSSGPSAPIADTKADAVRRAATLAFLAYYEPTGVVVNPADWEDMELSKDSDGRYLMSVSIQQGAEARLWRMPVIDTPAMPQGQALVGAFGTGAQLFDREGSSIRISEHHADLFVKNAIVVLAEQRLALAIKRPESFVKVSFDVA